jgi:hypothetical protein
MRRSLDADAKMEGLCGDHARCNTSSECPSNVCWGFPNLLVSCNRIVYLEPFISHPRDTGDSEANLVCTARKEKRLLTRMKCDR